MVMVVQNYKSGISALYLVNAYLRIVNMAQTGVHLWPMPDHSPERVMRYLPEVRDNMNKVQELKCLLSV